MLLIPPLDQDLQDRKNAMDEPTSGWLWESGYAKDICGVLTQVLVGHKSVLMKRMTQ